MTRSFPVTDPDLDAPDGAVVDGYERVGDRWVKRIDEELSARFCTHEERNHALGAGIFVCFECFARLVTGVGGTSERGTQGWTWANGNGGGALAVVLDANGRAFGWLCDEGTGSDRGPRIECFKWFLDGGASGEDADYDRARAALGTAASEYIRQRGAKSRSRK